MHITYYHFCLSQLSIMEKTNEFVYLVSIANNNY